MNAPCDRYLLNFKVISMSPHFRRRRMIFVDGKPFEQMDGYNDLFGTTGRSTNYYEELHWQPLFGELPRDRIGPGGGAPPSQPNGSHVVRGNTIPHCGSAASKDWVPEELE